MRIKTLKIAGQIKKVTIEKFNEIIEKGTPYEDMGTQEVWLWQDVEENVQK